jgi:hypothetical protein
MATTSQVTSYRAAGQPDDAVGAVGDICWDTQNRVTWVKQANNTWVGGAYSNIGPTGPAMLSGTGAPASGIGQAGNGYTDTATGNTYLKSSSGWALTGSIIGPTGPQGPSTLGSAGLAIGPAPSASAFAAGSTPGVLPLANNGQTPCQFLPTSASAFMGATLGNLYSAAVTFELYNQTTSTSVMTQAVASGTITTIGQFSATQYPLTANNVYVWRVTTGTAGSVPVYILPTYLTPSNSPSASVTYTGTAGFSANTTFTSTQVIAPVMGNTTAVPWEIRPFRSAYVYQVVATFTPSGSTPSSASLSLAFYAQGPNTTQATYTVTATGLPQIIANLQSTALPMTPNGTQYYWKVSSASSVTGYLSIETLCVL